jgi:hypothetical protein
MALPSRNHPPLDDAQFNGFAETHAHLRTQIESLGQTVEASRRTLSDAVATIATANRVLARQISDGRHQVIP